MFAFHTGTKGETRGKCWSRAVIQWMLRVFYAVCPEEAA